MTVLSSSKGIAPAHVKEIHERRDTDPWVSPNFKDGGWHTTPGCQEFVTEWEPRNDRMLVRLLPEVYRGLIHLPDKRSLLSPTRVGIVLKTGPGKWIPGEWWSVPKRSEERITGNIWRVANWREWEWFPGHREEMTCKPGMRVAIGKFTDWESNDAGWGDNVVICQQADVRVILS